jgi:hypothetical protein
VSAADELQAHRASAAAASQASLVMVGPHRRLSGTPPPPLAPVTDSTSMISISDY